MDHLYLTRINKTQSLMQTGQEKTNLGDHESKTLLSSSDVVIQPRQSISNGFHKKQFYSPNSIKTKAFKSEIAAFNQRVSNSDPSHNSMSISLESNDTPQMKIRTRQKTKKSVNQQPLKMISRNMEDPNYSFRQLQKDSIIQYSQNGLSQMTEEKKSYRKNHHKKVNMIPFRKCQSLIEERIVNAINKMDSGKQCEKQLRSLNQKLRKLSVRQIMNRYVISGVNVVCRMVHQQTLDKKINPDVQMFFEDTFNSIKKRIFDELDNVDTFVCENLSESDQGREEVNKIAIVRKIYKILKNRNRRQQKERIKKNSIQIAQKMFDGFNFSIENFVEAINIQNIQK